MSRRWRGLALPAVAWLGALVVASCARHPAPQLLPGPPSPGLRAYLEQRARCCGEVESYRAQGTLTVSMGDFRVQADEEVLFRSPDELCMKVVFDGFLWVSGARGTLILRGDSVYVSVFPGLSSWSGTAAEFLSDWSWRGYLALAAAREVAPAGPLGCRLDSEGGNGDLLEVSVVGEGRGQVRGVFARDGLSWDLLIDGVTGLPERCYVGRPGEKPVVASSLAEFRRVGDLLLPARIDLRSRDQEIEISVVHREQSLNPPLADSLFVPAGPGPGATAGGGDG